MTYDPLLSLAYHTEMKCIVCFDCRMAIPSKHIKGHITNADHRPKVGEGKLIVPHLKRDLDEYLSALVLDDNQVQRPAPKSVIPPYTWLEKPQKGWVCKICNDYACQTQETMRKHLNMTGTCRSSDRSSDKYSNNELMDPCFVQRFGPSHPFKSYFRVYPNVSVETGTLFTDFLSNLPDSLKEGAPLYSSDTRSIQTKEFDLPPFLAKTKWTEAVRGYSRRKMVISVALPSKDNQFFSRLQPLGKRLFTSIRSTTLLPHQILNGLTAYKTKK